MKSIKVLLAAVALMCTANLSYAQSIDDAVAKYTGAVTKLQASEFAEATALLKQAMDMGINVGEEGNDLVKEIQGLLPKVHLQAGVSQIKAQNYDDAIKELLVCEELADLYGDVQTMRQASRFVSGVYQVKGATAFNAKDFKTALESFSKGYAQDPSNVKLAALTAKTYAELGDLDKALPIFGQVIEAGDQNSKFAADAQTAREDVAMYVGVAVSAAAEAKEIEKVVSLADLVPQNADVALLVVQAANNMKKYDVVIARAEQAATLQANVDAKSSIYYLLGLAYNNTGNFPKAIETLNKVTTGANAAAAKALVVELKK